jgi:hypothetical protein
MSSGSTTTRFSCNNFDTGTGGGFTFTQMFGGM